MIVISTALGNCVNHAARRAAIFSGIVRGVYLKLTNGRLADRVLDTRAATLFGKESIVVIRPVKRIVI